MKVTLIVVPPGGGEAEYTLDFELPAVPREGEYITVARDDALADPKPDPQDGSIGIYECFYVRRAWWDLRYPSSAPYAKGEGQGPVGSAYMIAVEAETARGPHMTGSHRRSCETYERRGLPVRTFDNSAY
ncbi:hypothetical protein [Methylobacterium sp. J-076]|uniref:hypothetical protein n=1 Tax=Methylobacterium sp. J-076 TaxID=2836655 RepID=UPI001FB927C7|nr:hypothetical protein [Methylobacterium sp. J-076]MCJ2011083.1 hypothetical protein [Methylobacterium sp. J-076]